MEAHGDEWGAGGAGGAWAARALPAGWTSRTFSTDELVRHCCAPDPLHVLVDEQSGAALAAARLARDVLEAHLRLEFVPAPTGSGSEGEGAWRVRCERAAAAGAELRLWPADPTPLPFLKPTHIRGKKDYVCADCGASFERPNPLKVHLFLDCKSFSRRRFWARFLAERDSAGAAGSAPAREVLRRLHPAAAEALAAAWGARRGSGGGGGGGGSGGGHTCLYCGRVYSRRYGLKIHVRTHTGYKPLRCAHCRRAFADPSNLNKHLRLHRAPAATASPAHTLPGPQRHRRARHALGAALPYET